MGTYTPALGPAAVVYFLVRRRRVHGGASQAPDGGPPALTSNLEMSSTARGTFLTPSMHTGNCRSPQSLLAAQEGGTYLPRYVVRRRDSARVECHPSVRLAWEFALMSCGEVEGMGLRKRFMRSSFALALAAFVLLGTVGAVAAQVVARAAVVIDSDNGRTLVAKNPDLRMYPASTTKVMTAILAIESGRMSELITIRESDTRVEPSLIGLVPGERITLRDLVYGLLLRSGNDAARAIARTLAGSETQFAVMMNAKALKLGCTSTHFANPHGLPNPNHYTTARDLGRIMRYAMHNDEFREITGCRHYRSFSTARARDFYNKNKLLRLYKGANGGKPGYTRAAQQTLVASARRAEHELVVVCLASRGRALWSDASRLLDLGFSRLAAGGPMSSSGSSTTTVAGTH